jgi:hypothetical protein
MTMQQQQQQQQDGGERETVGKRFISSLEQKAMILWVELLYLRLASAATVMDLLNRLRSVNWSFIESAAASR